MAPVLLAASGSPTALIEERGTQFAPRDGRCVAVSVRVTEDASELAGWIFCSG